MELKEEILKELKKSEYISGEELAKRFFVSRNSVWKAVKKLREEGYEISAMTNRGYCLKGDNDKISAGAIMRNATREREFYILDEVSSTNDYARQLALDGREEAVVIAETQKLGRGRLGRKFYSPKGCGLYMSILCRPRINVELAPLITSYTAVATALAIDSLCGAETKIKWVNDIYMNGKKLCGILTEAAFDFEGGTVDYVIIGIGINVTGREFPKDISDRASSIEKESGARISRNDLAAAILNNMDGMTEKIGLKDYLNIYREKSNVIGRSVKVMYGNSSFDAEAIDIDDNAALVVKTADGVKKLNSGEVSIKI